MKVIRKNRTKRLVSLFKPLTEYFRAEVSSTRGEIGSVARSLFSTKRRVVGILLLMVALFTATAAYAATMTPVSNTQNVHWNLACQMASGAPGSVCLFFQTSGQNPDGTVTYSLRARYVTGSSSTATISNLYVSTTLDASPVGNTQNAVMLNGIAGTGAPPSWLTDGPFTLTSNVDQTFSYIITLGTGADAPQYGYYDLAVAIVQ